MRVGALVIVAVVAGCSNKPQLDEVKKASDGPLAARASVFWSKPYTNVGRGLIDEATFKLDLTRDGEPLDVPPGPSARGWCAPADKSTYELRVDGARGVVAHRCKPGDAWTVLLAGRIAAHQDCRYEAGAGAEPDLGKVGTVEGRAAVLADCAFQPGDSSYSFGRKLDTLVHDTHQLTKSDAKTAEVVMTALDALVAHDRSDWPRTVWGFDGEREEAWRKDRAIPAGVYPLVQAAAGKRLATETNMLAIASLAPIARADDPTLAASFAAAGKRLLTASAQPKEGARLRDATLTLLLAPLLVHAPKDAARLGCDALGAGIANGVAAIAVAKERLACPAAQKLVQAQTDYTPAWLEARCKTSTAAVSDAALDAIRDDKKRRKPLSSADFAANPSYDVPWEGAIVAAACVKPLKPSSP